MAGEINHGRTYTGNSKVKGTHGLTGDNSKGGDGVWFAAPSSGPASPLGGKGLTSIQKPLPSLNTLIVNL